MGVPITELFPGFSRIGYRCPICGLVADLTPADLDHPDAALAAAARHWEALKPE